MMARSGFTVYGSSTAPPPRRPARAAAARGRPPWPPPPLAQWTTAAPPAPPRSARRSDRRTRTSARVPTRWVQAFSRAETGPVSTAQTRLGQRRCSTCESTVVHLHRMGKSQACTADSGASAGKASRASGLVVMSRSEAPEVERSVMRRGADGHMQLKHAGLRRVGRQQQMNSAGGTLSLALHPAFQQCPPRSTKAPQTMLHPRWLPLHLRRTRSLDLSRSMVSYSLSMASWHSSLSVRASSAARTYSRSADRPLSKLPLYSLRTRTARGHCRRAHGSPGKSRSWSQVCAELVVGSQNHKPSVHIQHCTGQCRTKSSVFS